MDSEFAAAVRQICDEKGISTEQVYETIEVAIASAYRKDYGKPSQKIEAKFDPDTGKTKIYRVFDIVKEVENEDREMTKKSAKKYLKKPKIDDQVKIEEEAPESYGRIAAQTAKQVVVQKIRELERNVLFQDFKTKEHELLTGTVQQIEGRNVIVNLGRANGILLPRDQIEYERYYIGQRLKVFVVEVEETTKNPQILLSRTHPEMIRRLFELEVPEINAGSVEIKGIVREAGKRSKVAVIANQEGVDPVGSCVGQRGTRILSILAEIGEEKIDIILWDKDEGKYIENALSPAKIKSIKLNKKEKNVVVKVSEDQLSLTIGREGQNVRLASRLTGWEIEISKEEEKKGGRAEKANKANKENGTDEAEKVEKIRKTTDKKEIKTKKISKNTKTKN